MNCNEYREKFIHEEMTPAEEKEFREHLKHCEGCRIFVEKYKNMRDLIKVRTDYVPSNELKTKIISRVKKRQTFKKLYKVSLLTGAIIVFGTFFVWKPFTSGQNMYQRVASTGIEMLNTHSATSSNVSKNNDYSYLIHIKDVSDQF
jgi:predicted anti-sigma-YlaC factor YlaD